MCFSFFPETKQRSLEDVNVAFREVVAVRHYGASEEDEKIYKRAQEEEDRARHGVVATVGDKGVTIVKHVEKV